MGNIIVAKDQIDDVAFELQSYRNDFYLTANLSINEANQKNLNHLEDIIFFAIQDNLNLALVNECLDGPEDELINLLDNYIVILDTCFKETDLEGDQIQTDGNYRVDVIITKIYDLQFQLRKCSSDDQDCFNKLIDDIKKQTENLPLQIQVEVTQISNDADILKGKIQDCSESNVAAFAAKGIALINEIALCITSI